MNSRANGAFNQLLDTLKALCVLELQLFLIQIYESIVQHHVYGIQFVDISTIKQGRVGSDTQFFKNFYDKAFEPIQILEAKSEEVKTCLYILKIVAHLAYVIKFLIQIKKVFFLCRKIHQKTMVQTIKYLLLFFFFTLFSFLFSFRFAETYSF